MLPNERAPAKDVAYETVSDNDAEQHPIGRSDLVAFSLIALLIITVVAVLSFA